MEKGLCDQGCWCMWFPCWQYCGHPHLAQLSGERFAGDQGDQSVSFHQGTDPAFYNERSIHSSFRQIHMHCFHREPIQQPEKNIKWLDVGSNRVPLTWLHKGNFLNVWSKATSHLEQVGVMSWNAYCLGGKVIPAALEIGIKWPTQRFPMMMGWLCKIQNPCTVHCVSRQESLPKGFGFPLQLLDHSPLLSCPSQLSNQRSASRLARRQSIPWCFKLLIPILGLKTYL